MSPYPVVVDIVTTVLRRMEKLTRILGDRGDIGVVAIVAGKLTANEKSLHSQPGGMSSERR